MCLLRDMHAHAAALTETNPGVLISDAALPIDAQLPYTYRSADDEAVAAGSEKERLEKIRREQERAVVEEALRTPVLRSEVFDSRVNGGAAKTDK